MTDTTIFHDASGTPVAVQMPWEAYVELRSRAGEPVVDDAEDEEDRQTLAEARASDSGFRLPLEFVSRLIEGEHVLKVLRDFRGMDQAELARRMDTAPNYISQIETGARRGVRKAEAFARALDVPVEVIKGRL